MQDTRDMGSMQPEIRMSHRSAGEAVMYVHGYPKKLLISLGQCLSYVYGDREVVCHDIMLRYLIHTGHGA